MNNLISEQILSKLRKYLEENAEQICENILRVRIRKFLNETLKKYKYENILKPSETGNKLKVKILNQF